MYMQCFCFSWWCWWWCGCELRQVREAKEELRNTVSSASAGYVRNPFEDLADLAQKKMQGTLSKGCEENRVGSTWRSCSAYVLWEGILVMRQSPPMWWSSAGRWCNNMLPKVPWDSVAVQVETEAWTNLSLCMLEGSPDMSFRFFGRSPQQNRDCRNSGVVGTTSRQTHSFESRLKGVGSKEPFLCGSIDRPCTGTFCNFCISSNESMRVDANRCSDLTRLRASFRILRDMCLEKQGSALVRLCQFGIHCSLTSSQGFDVMRLCCRSSWWRTNELQVQ